MNTLNTQLVNSGEDPVVTPQQPLQLTSAGPVSVPVGPLSVPPPPVVSMRMDSLQKRLNTPYCCGCGISDAAKSVAIIGLVLVLFDAIFLLDGVGLIVFYNSLSGIPELIAAIYWGSQFIVALFGVIIGINATFCTRKEKMAKYFMKFWIVEIVFASLNFVAMTVFCLVFPKYLFASTVLVFVALLIGLYVLFYLISKNFYQTIARWNTDEHVRAAARRASQASQMIVPPFRNVSYRGASINDTINQTIGASTTTTTTTTATHKKLVDISDTGGKDVILIDKSDADDGEDDDDDNNSSRITRGGGGDNSNSNSETDSNSNSNSDSDERPPVMSQKSVAEAAVLLNELRHDQAQSSAIAMRQYSGIGTFRPPSMHLQQSAPAPGMAALMIATPIQQKLSQKQKQKKQKKQKKAKNQQQQQQQQVKQDDKQQEKEEKQGKQGKKDKDKDNDQAKETQKEKEKDQDQDQEQQKK